MDNDDATFWDKKNKTNKKQHKNKCVEKKKKDKKKTLSLEEEYYGPLSKLTKKKSMYLLRCTMWARDLFLYVAVTTKV